MPIIILSQSADTELKNREGEEVGLPDGFSGPARRSRIRGWVSFAFLLVALSCFAATLVPFPKDALIRVVGRDGKYGFITPSGRIAVDLEWDWAFRFEGGITKAAKDGKFRWIDDSGRELPEEEWPEGNPHFKSPYSTEELSNPDHLELTTKLSKKYGDHEFGEFDQFDRTWLMDNPVSNYIIGWIDSSGELVIPLPGSLWQHADARSLDKTYFRAFLQPGAPGYYAAKRRVSARKVKRWMYQVGNWFRDIPKSAPIEFDCLCYDWKGDLVWSNEWMPYEQKCYIAGFAALLIAGIVKPRRKRSRR